MNVLKLMKKLRELLIGDNSSSKEYQSILKKEIPHLEIRLLEIHTGQNQFNSLNYLEVADTNTEDFKGIKFCPNCLEYENENYSHDCLTK